MGHDPHTSTLVVICIVRLLFVLFYVLFVCKCVLLPGDNPIAVNIYSIYHIITHSRLIRRYREFLNQIIQRPNEINASPIRDVSQLFKKTFL
jgi:hypothetical protein